MRALMYCFRIWYNTIPMHGEVKLCKRNLHSSPRVRNNSHYQQSLHEHTEPEFATGHITTIESGTCKDGKWEEEGWGGRRRRRRGGKKRESKREEEAVRKIHWQKWNKRGSKSVGWQDKRTKERREKLSQDYDFLVAWIKRSACLTIQSNIIYFMYPSAVREYPL